MDMTEAVMSVTVGERTSACESHYTGASMLTWVNAKVDISEKYGTSNGGETRSHSLVNFSRGEVGDVWLDAACRFTLTDEW